MPTRLIQKQTPPAQSTSRLAGFFRAMLLLATFATLTPATPAPLAFAQKKLQTYQATDTLNLPTATSAPLTTLYNNLRYPNQTFTLRLVPSGPTPFTTTDAPILLRFPSPHTQTAKAANTVTLEYFPATTPVNPTPQAPAVLVLHSVFPRMSIGRAVARALAQRGIHAFMMHAPGFGLRDIPGPRISTDFFTRQTIAVADARRAYDAIAALPQIDPTDIAILGVSLGAFVATHTAALDDTPVFANNFLILAGADLYTVITEGQRDAAHIRRSLLIAGIQDEKLRGLCDPLDPARVGPRLNPATTYLYSAKLDTVVPPKNAQALADAINFTDHPDHHTWLDADHYTTGLHIPWIVQHVANIILNAAQ